MKIWQFTKRALIVLVISGCVSGCVGTIVGAAVDTTIEVVKVPFKVAGAAIDVATPDKDDDES